MTPLRPIPTSIALAASLLASVAAAEPPPASFPANLPQPRSVPADAGAERLSFAPLVRRAAPAVVNVFSKRLVHAQVDPFWGMFMGAGVPRDRVEQSLGSGSIVRADGLVLTNHHVIDGAQEIMVVTADRREWPAKVLLDDARADLAVLKIDPGAERLPTIAIADTEDVEVGDLVLAIGDPFGVGQTVTNGIVSALARSDVGISDYSFFIQTDAAINPGNSGGPLVDMHGDMIGVNTAIVSRSGGSSGIGFAIPAALAKQVVAAAIGGHAVVRPWLGVKAQALTGEMAKSLGLAAPQGVLVAELWPDGPAARAGVEQGDVIVSVDGEAVNDDAGLNYRVATRKPGDTVEVVLRKTAGDRTLAIHVDAPPDTPAPQPRTIAGNNPLNGATVVNVSPAGADALGLDPFAGRGVLISKIDPGYAARLGLQVGDFVRQVNGQAITTTDDLVRVLATPQATWTMVVQRGGQTITVQVRV